MSDFQLILFFAITGFFAYMKSIQMISNGKEGLIQVLLTYYSMLAMIGVITGVLKPLWF